MSTSSETWQLGSQTVQVSHLKKLYWPTAGFTKSDLLHYYRQIAHAALPHFKDHPVTLRMFPQGVDGVSHYMRDYPDYAPTGYSECSTVPRLSGTLFLCH